MPDLPLRRTGLTLPVPVIALAPVIALILSIALAPLIVLTALPAYAQTSDTGPESQVLTVSRAEGLSPSGETITVTGSGYDVDKGIYVAYCVDNGPGELPTPCGGGADTTGSLGASHWISSNPPAYGEGLAVPYGDGGSFSVTLNVTPAIGDVDCTTRTCAVVTRADHTRTSDRTQDVRIPVSFATGDGPPDTAPDDPPAESAQPGAGGGPVVITAGPVPTRTAEPAADALDLTRVGADGSAGRWWLASTGALGGLLLLLLVTGWASRRRRRKRAAQ